MTTYDYMRKTVIEPLIERNEAVREKRRAEGRAEGREEGRAQGQSEMHARISEWNARRLEAESRGEPFDEPMPAPDASPNGHSPQG